MVRSRLPEDDPIEADQFPQRPRLKRATARRVRQFGIGDLGNMPETAVIEMINLRPFDLGLKPKPGIFMVNRVIVAAREKRGYRHDCLGRFVQHSPGKRDQRSAVEDKDLLLYLSPALKCEDPCRPWCAVELDDVRCAVRMHDVGRTKL